MKLTNKEQYLLKSGRSIDTIKFCKECGVKSDNIAWFVDRIEKDGFDISKPSSKDDIIKILNFFKKDRRAKDEYGKNIFKTLEAANEVIETEDNIKSRILHTFNDGHYIINLTHKELLYEGFEMSNCVNDLQYLVKTKKTAVLALKDKKSKTICHMEIGQNGSLGQHYQKANSIVSRKTWTYVNEFFQQNQDKDFYKKMKDNNLNILFSIRKDYDKFFPNILSEIPTKYTVSVLDSKNKSYSDFVALKEYSFLENNIFGINKDRVNFLEFSELKDYINKVKENINNSLNDFLSSIEMSKDNYFILNDEVIKRIYGKVFHSNLDEKIKSILHPEDVKICEEDPFEVYPDYPVEQEPLPRPQQYREDYRAWGGARLYNENEAYANIVEKEVAKIFSEEEECEIKEGIIPEEFIKIINNNCG